MKHLVNGVAIAAALAIAVPAWAQAPMSPSSSGAPKAAAAPAATAAAAPAKPRHKRMSHRMARGGEPSMTDQLNRAELARIQGGGMAPAMPQTESTMPARIGAPKQP